MTLNRRMMLGVALTLLGAAASGSTTTVTLSLRDSAGAVVPGAAVWLEGPGLGPTRSPSLAVVDQRDRMFVPQVTVVQTGAEISFPNSDSVSHHVYSFAQPNSFELPLYKGGTRPNIRFEHPGVVVLGCNIHDSMLGYIVVVDTPVFGTTDSAGSITLTDVPPGNYQIRAWSPRLDPARPLAAGSLSVGAQEVSQALAVARRMRPAPGDGGSLAKSDY